MIPPGSHGREEVNGHNMKGLSGKIYKVIDSERILGTWRKWVIKNKDLRRLNSVGILMRQEGRLIDRIYHKARLYGRD